MRSRNDFQIRKFSSKFGLAGRFLDLSDSDAKWTVHHDEASIAVKNKLDFSRAFRMDRSFTMWFTGAQIRIMQSEPYWMCRRVLLEIDRPDGRARSTRGQAAAL